MANKKVSRRPRYSYSRWRVGLTGLVTVPLLALFLYYAGWALCFDMDKVSHMPATSIIFDRHGYVIQRLYDENRILVNSSQIPDILRKAVMAKEDERFRWHPGFDLVAITRAFLGNIFKGHVSSGASTITQQLARNSAGMFERTFDRKMKELFLAVRIELTFSKDEILTFYLNRIYFGGNLYGVGAAADAFFAKAPKDLNLSESAMLAGIIAGPNSFSPWKNSVKAREVRAKTLERMVKAGYISADQQRACNAQPLVLRPLVDKPGSYVTATVIENLPSFLTPEHIFRGGLRIYTTIDLAFQRAAEQKIETGLEALESESGYAHSTRARYLAGHQGNTETPNYVQAAFVAINNADGGVLAIIGGRNFDESPYNRAILAKRQIGSTVKPFVYANAFNTLNFTAFTEIDHRPFDLRNLDASVIPAGPDPDFISVRQAIENSDNYAAMRVGLASGLESFCYLFEQATGEKPQAYPSSLLGSCVVTPYELVSAYTLFPNYGVHIKPHLVERIETYSGALVFQHIDERKRILSPQIAFQITHLLQGVVDHGTANQLRTRFGLTGDLAGKTGTTNEYRDSWFMGFTTEMTAGLWVGMDKPQTIVPGGYASHVSVPIWGSIMKLANQNYKPASFAPPPGVQLAQQKKEEKVFFFFKKTSVGETSEYVRDDQRGTALERLDQNTTTVLTRQQEPKGLLTKAWESIWAPEPEDHFQSGVPSEEHALIQDNSETRAPHAAPAD